jgi:hypothetical protein
MKSGREDPTPYRALKEWPGVPCTKRESGAEDGHENR